ncbi:uncharacterized protein EV420DRAFT_1486585 [Desarmillaria tabescens]|uniref:Uncharacterized protein n=1 Tax=Armillaria tabescens TaxID=1929756 RepID=A0AA39MMH1_ARMTA|nr:uncharacterized protein EV420DRAFT_1486585 [Desarmillaria tabescens]KAK0438860.1 hypothetical protein EV420DRAFT_1486585 [Desarmillaria tabescens]
MAQHAHALSLTYHWSGTVKAFLSLEDMHALVPSLSSRLLSASINMNATDSYAPLLSLNNEHYLQKCCGAITCICDVQGNKGEDSTCTQNPSPSDTESESDGWSDASSLDPLLDTTPPTIPAYSSSVPGPIDFMVLDSSLDDTVGNMSAIFLKYIQAFPPSTSAHELHDALQNLYDILQQVEELA